MTVRCRTCHTAMTEEQAGERTVWWCDHCRVVDFAPIRLVTERPRSSQDRHELEDGTDAA